MGPSPQQLHQTLSATKEYLTSMPEAEESQRTYNILALGIEKKGLTAPEEPLRTRNFSIFFEKYNTPRRLNEYDGVILFQGIFEKFKSESHYMGSYITHTYDQDELDKRKKEAAILVAQGGFICFLLTDPFIDRNDRQNLSNTDLAKHHLNYAHLYRENFTNRIAHVTCLLDEFRRFLDIYGAANSHIKSHNNSLELRVIAEVQGAPVGYVIGRHEYFIPSLVPDNRPNNINEYFELLADSLTASNNKLQQDLPKWISSFRFSEEISLLGERTSLDAKIEIINKQLDKLAQYKAALIHTGVDLVADVSRIFDNGLGIKVNAVDDFREDIKLLDENDQPICVCEVKGINRGIKRENINQTDSHRERSGFDSNFPALLVANTNIKGARSIEEKEQEIADEQVRHAAHLNVLVMRTIDLLGLLELVLSGKISRVEALRLLLSGAGWLRVQGGQATILTGN